MRRAREADQQRHAIAEQGRPRGDMDAGSFDHHKASVGNGAVYCCTIVFSLAMAVEVLTLSDALV
jgi:hypothetical protein